MNVVLTQQAPTTATLSCSWSASMSALMKPQVKCSVHSALIKYWSVVKHLLINR